MGRRTDAANDPGLDLTKLVQCRISQQAQEKMRAKIAKIYQRESEYVRQLIYRDLGLIKKGG